jgi:hypothetical protein
MWSAMPNEPIWFSYLSILNEPQSAQEELAIRQSVMRSSPYGQNEWVQVMARRFNLESTLQPGAGFKKVADPIFHINREFAYFL